MWNEIHIWIDSRELITWQFCYHFVTIKIARPIQIEIVYRFKSWPKEINIIFCRQLYELIATNKEAFTSNKQLNRLLSNLNASNTELFVSHFFNRMPMDLIVDMVWKKMHLIVIRLFARNANIQSNLSIYWMGQCQTQQFKRER